MERFAVMSSEIASLPPLTYYLLVDKYLTKASRQYEKFQQIAEPIVLYQDKLDLDMSVDFSSES
jgi:hypothetical protein